MSRSSSGSSPENPPAKTVRNEALFAFRWATMLTSFASGRRRGHEIVTARDAARGCGTDRVRAGEEEIQLVDGHAGYFEELIDRNFKTRRANVVRGF